MDKTTKAEVKRILKQGWYRKSQTLGEGGWGEIEKQNDHFNYYELSGIECQSWKEFESICAKDDKTALEAFKSLYNLEEIDSWEIHEKVVEYRIVTTQELNGELRPN